VLTNHAGQASTSHHR
jgi:hypothetical protein